MFYRLSVAAIVGFWLLMATLLVRTEWFPRRTDGLPVPVDYVKRLVFRHEMSSDLVLYRQRRRGDGNFHIQPKRVGPDREQPGAGSLLTASGNFLLNLPAAAPQRVVFHGSLEIDERENVRRVDLSVSLHEHKQNPSGLTLHLDGSPEERRWHYQVIQNSEILQEARGTPEEILGKLDLPAYGLDPRIFARANPQASPAHLTAERGSLRVGDDEVETYVVTIHHSDTLRTTIHVNQLGQILAVKTFLGFDFYDETITP